MPITPFLRNQAFDPEIVRNMSDAFTQACTELGLSNRSDGFSELVASHIVALAQRGVHTKTALYLLTVKEFTAKAQ